MSDLCSIKNQLRCSAERQRLTAALVRCAAIGGSQVKEVVERALADQPLTACGCKIEMGTFRHKGAHCTHCGGVIG